MEKKVFVLLAHREHESYSPSSEVVGLFSTHEKAETAMKSAMETELADELAFGDGYEQEDLEIKYGSDRCSIFDFVGGLEYTEFQIVEKEVQ